MLSRQQIYASPSFSTQARQPFDVLPSFITTANRSGPSRRGSSLPGLRWTRHEPSRISATELRIGPLRSIILASSPRLDHAKIPHKAHPKFYLVPRIAPPRCTSDACLHALFCLSFRADFFAVEFPPQPQVENRRTLALISRLALGTNPKTPGTLAPSVCRIFDRVSSRAGAQPPSRRPLCILVRAGRLCAEGPSSYSNRLVSIS